MGRGLSKVMAEMIDRSGLLSRLIGLFVGMSGVL